MTSQSITSTPEQGKQFKRFVEDASDRALKEVTPDKDGLQRLITRGGEFQAYLVTGIRRFIAKMPNYDVAKTILGKDFISPEEIAKARGLVYTDEQLATFRDTLPAQEALEWCRDNGMMLIAGPPKAMSLLEIRALKSAYFYRKEGDWYAEDAEAFSRNDKAEPVWIALRKEPVTGSFDKDWAEQNALVVAPLVVPNAAEVAWGLTTYMALCGTRLLPNVYVRTSSCGSDGDRVPVGDFDSRGIGVDDFWDDGRSDLLGVSAARKF